jgi:AraC-like DNA-binding protein
MENTFHVSLNHNPPGCRNAYTPHTHKHHELLYCTAGVGGQYTDRRQFPLRAGDLFFFPAGMCHCSLLGRGQKFECFVLDFHSGLFTPALAGDKEARDVVEKMAAFEGRVPLSAAGGQQVHEVLDALLGEFRRKERAYHAVLKMLSLRLLITLARDTEFHRQGLRVCPAPSHDDMIREVLQYLEVFYMNAVTVESVLEFCPMSRSHFHAVFKRATGRTLVAYLTELRLKKAAEQLRTSGAPVAEIAERTGFRSSSYFGLLFRRATGLSPGDYRRRFHAASR